MEQIDSVNMEESETSCDQNSSAELETNQQKKKYLFLDEAYFDEWWDNLDSRVEKKSFGEHEEEIFKHSVILKSFRNEYETDSLLTKSTLKSLLEGQIDLKKEAGNPPKTSLEILVPGYNPNSFIPNTSSLTFAEMMTCLLVMEAGSPQNRKQFNTWAVCKPKLDEEQRQYIEYAKEQWKVDSYKRHTEIKPDMKELVDLLWKARLERVYTLPKFYAQIENIALLTTTSSEEVELKFIKQLESIGRPSRYFIPDLWTFVVNINTMSDSMMKPPIGWSNRSGNTQICYKDIPSKLLDGGYHSDVSKDKIAERIAKENGVDIVMSSSAFTHLVDSQPLGYNAIWNLPVTVTEYQTDRGVRRIVFIDKKLPPLSMTAVDRIKYYSKSALRKLFIRPPNLYRDPSTSIYDADSVETFGVDSPVKNMSYKRLRKRKKIKCTYCLQKEICIPDMQELDISSPPVKNGYNSDSEESSSFYIDIDEETVVNNQRQEGIEQVTKEITTPTNEEVSVISSHNKDESIVFPSTSKEISMIRPTKEISHSNAPANGLVIDNCTCTYEWVEEETDTATIKKKLKYQVVYNLWEFNSSASQNYMSKNCSKNLKVLIRTTTEGVVKEKSLEGDKPLPVHYKLSPKLEYQTEFGAEAATLTEILREWASVYIRPFTTLARVRLDGITGELIQIQQLSATDLVTECQRLYKVNPRDRLPSIHTILVKLTSLPAGIYRLCCTPKIGTFVQLLRSVNSGGSQITNLHLQYNKVDPTIIAQPVSPFPALDPAIITPTFAHFKRVPCTFAPKRARPKRSLLKDNSVVNPPSTTSQRKKTGKKKKKKAKKV